MIEDDERTREPDADTDSGDGGYAIVVLDTQGHEIHPLPDRGVISIGRSDRASLRVDRPWISRAHANLHMGEPISIEDLGSSNRVRVNGQDLKAGEKRAIDTGDVVLLGTTMLVVQRRRVGDVAQPALAVPDFVARVDQDCDRASRLGLVVEVVAVIADASSSAPSPEWDVRSVLGSTQSLSVFAVQPMGPFLVASIGKRPGPKQSGSPLAARLEEPLRARGIAARIGSATAPDDGSSAAALVALATTRARERAPTPIAAPRGLHDEVSALEKQRIVAALESCNGNQSQAAKKLGIARNTLIARMKAFGLASKTPSA